jgi:L-ascorbate metabolism protein UlaG (beta-lactamase superfamily)
MKITKLTDDSSWWIETNDFSLVIDPWFSTQQVDGHPWFSLQKRAQSYGPFVFPENKPLYIFVSHPFSDHCHQESLLTFPKETVVFAENRALKKINSWGYFNSVQAIAAAPFKLSQLTKVSLLNQTHHAFVFALEGKLFLYAPHGVKSKHDLPRVDVLITTTTTYSLPFFLGGTVNLGLKESRAVLDKTKAKLVLATHDQRKESRGLVGWFAKPQYENDSTFKILLAGECLSLADLI